MTSPPPGLQLFYAKILDRSAKLGFGLLLFTFALYISGLLSPYVPVEELPRYWSRPASYYLEVAGIKSGWAWLGELHHGDFLNFLPIAILAGVPLLGYLLLAGKFFQRREIIPGILALLQLVVLILVASGLIRIGGH